MNTQQQLQADEQDLRALAVRTGAYAVFLRIDQERAELSTARDEISALRDRLAEKDREIDRLDLRWQEVNDQLASAREEIAKLQRLYAERCNEADNAYIAPGGEPR